MKTSFIAIASLLMITGCSSVLEGPTQQVTLLTPGAENAECMIHNKDFRYQMTSNETRKIMRSEHDMVVDCLAPGNREKSIVVENDLSRVATGNIATLGLGAAYDYYDNSLYTYPSVITVDFRNTPPQSYGLPQHHAEDLPDPSTLPVENYTPSLPKVDEDRFKPQPILQKIDRGMDEDMFVSEPTPLPEALPPVTSAPVSVSPSSPGTTADELTRSMNPQVFQ
ncbi:MAG: hypothetical protein AAF569_08105 [Pseudomonadota bacterium]